MKFNNSDILRALNRMQYDVSAKKYTITDIKKGSNIELEHGSINEETNVTNDDLVTTVKIALAHLNEDPQYYEKLEKIEGGGLVVPQSLLFDNAYTPEYMHKFIKKYNFHPIKEGHKTTNYTRFRLHEPITTAQYYTIQLKKGIMLLMMRLPQ